MPLLLLGLAIVAVVGIAAASTSRPSTQDDDTLIDQNGVTWDLQRSLEPIPGGKSQYSGVPRGTVYPVEARFMFRDTMGTVRAEILAYAAKWAIDHPKTPGGGGVPAPQSMGTYTDENLVHWKITFTPSVMSLLPPWEGTAGGSGIYAGTMLTDTSDALLKKKIDALAAGAKKYAIAGSTPSALAPPPPACGKGAIWSGENLGKTGPDLYQVNLAMMMTEPARAIVRRLSYQTGGWETGGVAFGQIVEVLSGPASVGECALFWVPKEG